MGKSRLCGSCKHTWDPKGRARSKCPMCNSTDLRFVIDNPNKVEAEPNTPPPPTAEIPPVFGSWNETPDFGRAPASTPVSRSQTQGRDPGKPPKQDKQSKGSFGKLLTLFVIVIAILGGLVLLKTGGKLPAFFKSTTQTTQRSQPKPKKPMPAKCLDIRKRYRYAKQMATKAPKKWTKWVKHWAKKAKRQQCEF